MFNRMKMKDHIGMFWTMLLEDGRTDSPDRLNICEGSFPDWEVTVPLQADQCGSSNK